MLSKNEFKISHLNIMKIFAFKITLRVQKRRKDIINIILQIIFSISEFYSKKINKVARLINTFPIILSNKARKNQKCVIFEITPSDN